jgi:hypothetical protein
MDLPSEWIHPKRFSQIIIKSSYGIDNISVLFQSFRILKISVKNQILPDPSFLTKKPKYRQTG